MRPDIRKIAHREVSILKLCRTGNGKRIGMCHPVETSQSISLIVSNEQRTDDLCPHIVIVHSEALLRRRGLDETASEESEFSINLICVPIILDDSNLLLSRVQWPGHTATSHYVKFFDNF